MELQLVIRFHSSSLERYVIPGKNFYGLY